MARWLDAIILRFVARVSFRFVLHPPAIVQHFKLTVPLKVLSYHFHPPPVDPWKISNFKLANLSEQVLPLAAFHSNSHENARPL